MIKQKLSVDEFVTCWNKTGNILLDSAGENKQLTWESFLAYVQAPSKYSINGIPYAYIEVSEQSLYFYNLDDQDNISSEYLLLNMIIQESIITKVTNTITIVNDLDTLNIILID